jgi:glycosyltransferase 2 family protein
VNTNQPGSRRRNLALILKGILSLALIVWIARNFEFRALALQFREVRPSLLVLSGTLILLQTVGGAARWQAIIAAQGGNVDFLTTFRIYYIGVFFATCTPGGVLGDIVRAWHAHRAGLIISSAISSVVLDRLVVVVYLVAISIATVHFLPPAIQKQYPIGLTSALLLVALLAGLGTPLAIRYLPPHWRSRPSVGKLAALSSSMLSVTLRPFSLAWIFCLTAASQVTLCAAFYALSQSINMPVGFVDFMILMPLVIVASILPISLGGWGMRETAMIFVLGLVGVAPERALVLSILVGVLAIVISLPGGVLWILFPQSRSPDLHAAAASAGARQQPLMR